MRNYGLQQVARKVRWCKKAVCTKGGKGYAVGNKEGYNLCVCEMKSENLALEGTGFKEITLSGGRHHCAEAAHIQKR